MTAKKNVYVAAAVLAAGALALTGCSGSGSAASSSQSGSKTLTVWFMQDSLANASISAVTKQFESETGAKVKVELQQWDNIDTKLATALATNNPPDVVEIGNTDVPLFAANGALEDITSSKKELSGGEDWLTGLVGPATVNGKLYAAPLYGGTRVMIYNKLIWSKAGITSAPTTFDQLEADLDKIKAKNPSPDFSACYISGTNWYSGLSFLYDAGGSLAAKSNGKWQGEVATPSALKGLKEFAAFQNAYSTVASRTAPLDTPDPESLFSTQKAATVMLTGATVAEAESSNPALKNQVGTFTMPSPNHPDQAVAAPSFLGGSDLGIAARSKNQALALKFLKLMTSDSVQVNQITKVSDEIPISNQLVTKVLPTISPELKAFYVAAEKSISTPAAPGWGTIETDQSVLNYFSQVASGQKSAQDAANSFQSHLTSALNAAPNS